MNLLFLLNSQNSEFYSSKVESIIQNKDKSYEVLLSSPNGNTEKYVITFDGSFDAKVNHTFTNGNNTVISDLLIIDGYVNIKRSNNFIVARKNENGTHNYYGKETPYSKVLEETGNSYKMKR